MSFQEEFLSCFLSKEEYEIEQNNTNKKNGFDAADTIYDEIKNGILSFAKQSKYETEDGKKIIYFYYELPSQYKQDLEKEITPKKNGLYNAHYFIQENKNSEFHFFIYQINKFAKQDSISLSLCIQRANDIYMDKTYYDLPVTLYSIKTPGKSFWNLVLKASYIIPEGIEEVTPICINKSALNNHLHSELIDVDNMNGLDFEDFCASILSFNGFTKISVTSGSGDQGIDIIAYKDEIKYGIQCKCYSSNVGNKSVQEAFAGKQYYKCHVGVVLTNRLFTASAKTLAESNGIILWDRYYLKRLIQNAGINTTIG